MTTPLLSAPCTPPEQEVKALLDANAPILFDAVRRYLSQHQLHTASRHIKLVGIIVYWSRECKPIHVEPVCYLNNAPYDLKSTMYAGIPTHTRWTEYRLRNSVWTIHRSSK